MVAYVEYLIITIILIAFTKFNIERGIVIGRYKSKFVGWFAEWGIFTSLAALRYVGDGYGGADAQNYIDCFLYGYEYSSEKLFYFIGRVIRSFTDNYHVYFFFVYGIIVAGILLFAKEIFEREVSIPILFLYFNIYCTSFGVLRQWLAIAIGMMALVLIKKKRKILGFMVAICSGLIHFTMLAMGVVVAAYYIVCWISKHIKSGQVLPQKLITSGIAINLITIFLSGIVIVIVSKGEYSAYVDVSVLSSVSWLGYIPSIVCLILCLYYEREIVTDDYSKLQIFCAWAHFSTLYLSIALGFSRLVWCFFPIRVFVLYKLRNVISDRYVWSQQNRKAVPALFDVIVLLDGCIYMWRTISNEALPYLLDIRMF